MKPTRTKPLTILLVEDHSDTREAMRGWFKMEGYTVLQAGDIESALRLGRKTAFDLLICDVQLPDGDGRALLEKLSPDRKIVGIAMSGHCAPADLARSRAAGFVRHLIKPFRIEELESVLASARQELAQRNPTKSQAVGPQVRPGASSHRARQ